MDDPYLKKSFGILLALLVLLLLFIYNDANKDAERRERSELYMLDIIGAGVEDHLSTGGQVPTNWLELSNVINWEVVAKFSDGKITPKATELYAVLARPVAFNSYVATGSVFLVRSQPFRREGRPLGRWVLVGASNRVARIWMGEKGLMPEIRAQIGSEKDKKLGKSKGAEIVRF